MNAKKLIVLMLVLVGFQSQALSLNDLQGHWERTAIRCAGNEIIGVEDLANSTLTIAGDQFISQSKYFSSEGVASSIGYIKLKSQTSDGTAELLVQKSISAQGSSPEFFDLFYAPYESPILKVEKESGKTQLVVDTKIGSCGSGPAVFLYTRK